MAKKRSEPFRTGAGPHNRPDRCVLLAAALFVVQFFAAMGVRMGAGQMAGVLPQVAAPLYRAIETDTQSEPQDRCRDLAQVPESCNMRRNDCLCVHGCMIACKCCVECACPLKCTCLFAPSPSTQFSGGGGSTASSDGA